MVHLNPMIFQSQALSGQKVFNFRGTILIVLDHFCVPLPRTIEVYHARMNMSTNSDLQAGVQKTAEPIENTGFFER